MTEKNLSEAIKNILEKELKNFSKLIPNDVLKNIGKNVSPQIENMIEENGFVRKSKYQNLEKIIDDLEKRLSELEKN
jgi:polyhydroxyalkanoate synthesis regulator phasin|tara:strand:- start:3525 stop:3755 length:231 start_codon:yes stop_codon:yes gene_type:complete